MHVPRMFVVAMLMGGLVACTSGTKGEQGATGPRGAEGPTGPQGPIGSQGPAATAPLVSVWRDANGTFVGPLVSHRGVFHFDARGLLWLVEPSTGQFDLPPRQSYYPEADCKGTAYVSTLLPRLVFQVAGDSADTFRTFPDRYTATKIPFKSARYDTSCFNFTDEIDAVPLTDTLPTTPIVKPAITFVGPLRMATQ